ncbi:MAG: hypothetical protein A4E53_04568 [Pelotomaculum sp. PtaB.Bin104]|nr:MAG: hypothetical protein A4E53_04568 [Pelotomaculum sp. PtaB.Bin104]
MTGLDVKIARIKVGLKGYQLVQMVGINADVMSKIENNRIKPNPELLNKIKDVIYTYALEQAQGNVHKNTVRM